MNSATLVMIVSMSAGPLLANQAQDFTDFGTCVASASGPQWSSSTQTCTLPYYSAAYMVNSTITISSSSVRYISTGSGGTASTWPQAILKNAMSPRSHHRAPLPYSPLTQAQRT